MMEKQLVELVSSQGIWACLTVILFFYTLRTQEKRDAKQEEREKKYQDIICQLTDKLNILGDIKKDIEDVKDNILK